MVDKTPKKKRWWKRNNSAVHLSDELDEDILDLLEDVEEEFKISAEYHAKRLKELKEALHAREQANDGQLS